MDCPWLFTPSGGPALDAGNVIYTLKVFLTYRSLGSEVETQVFAATKRTLAPFGARSFVDGSTLLCQMIPELKQSVLKQTFTSGEPLEKW